MIGTIVSGALALGNAILSGVKSRNEKKKAEKREESARNLIQSQRDKNRAWYDTRMSRDYTLRSDVQAAINKQRELLDEQYNRTRATNIVAGGTDASLALQREAANRATAQMGSDVAAAAAAYKDNVEQQYLQQDAALNQQQVAQEMQAAQSHRQQSAQIAQAGGQAVSAALNAMGNGIAAKGMNVAGAPAGGGTPPLIPPKTENTIQLPDSIPAPAGQILSPDELPKVRKQSV